VRLLHNIVQNHLAYIDDVSFKITQGNLRREMLDHYTFNSLEDLIPPPFYFRVALFRQKILSLELAYRLGMDTGDKHEI